MKNKKNIIKIFLAAGIICSVLSVKPAAALDSDDVGTYGGVFMRLPIGSARAQALGENGVSIVSGSDAMTVNPAGIASAQMREISFASLEWVQDYSGKYLSYIVPYGQFVLGVNGAYYKIDDFDARDSDGYTVTEDGLEMKDLFGSVSIARSFFMEHLLFGATVKYVEEDTYYDKYNRVVYDLGGILRFGKLSFGYSSLNMNGKTEVPKIIRVGGAFKFNDYLTVLFESKKYSDRGQLYGGGAELTIPEDLLQVGSISLRAGYTPADDRGYNYDDSLLEKLGMRDTDGWSFGIGIESSESYGYSVGIDYTIAPFGALGRVDQLMVKCKF